MLRSIVSHIQSSFWFSIIVDEATDISRNEHMSLSINGLMTAIKSMRSVSTWFNCLLLKLIPYIISFA